MRANPPRRRRARRSAAGVRDWPSPACATQRFVALTFGLCLFPLFDGNDADIDSMANAAAFAALALGLNIVVGIRRAARPRLRRVLRDRRVFLRHPDLVSGDAGVVAVLAAVRARALVERINQGSGDVVHFTLSFWLALPLAAIVAAFFGVLFGAPTLRLRGDYLAIVTLGFGEIVPIIARNTPSLTNGAAGLNGVQAPHLFGYNFAVQATPYYYVGLGLVAVLLFASVRLRDLAHRPRLDGDPRGRDRRPARWASTRAH